MNDLPILSPREISDLLHCLCPANGTALQQMRSKRNRCIALLMLDAGLRNSEVCNLEIRDIFWNGQVRETLEMRSEISKYNVGGRIPLSPGLRDALTAYAQAYGIIPADDPTAPLFFGVHRSAKLSTRQIHRMIAEAGREATGRKIWPHRLRHTFGDAIAQATDLPTTQALLRHKHLSSTEVYMHPDDARKASAITRLSHSRKEANS